MAAVFEEESEALPDGYVDELLARRDFWIIAAEDEDGEILGGLTAHTLPMTRAAYAEIFLYDIAVRVSRQRRGVGRALVACLREQAAALGITDVFVPAENEDAHALDFYRALGGAAQEVTFFNFTSEETAQARAGAGPGAGARG